MYQDADIYLLDDPLSAVDSHVGKHIFEKVVGPEGVLKNKVHNNYVHILCKEALFFAMLSSFQARVLVTHGMGFLPQCDTVMCLNEGNITEMGSYEELMMNNGDFAEFISVFTNTEGDQDGDPGTKV